MDFFISTKQRTNKEEIMDDFSIGGDLLRDTLDKLENINRWLGGNKVTLLGLKKILQNQPKDKIYTIVDIGCGHGDILRDIAKFGKSSLESKSSPVIGENIFVLKCSSMADLS